MDFKKWLTSLALFCLFGCSQKQLLNTDTLEVEVLTLNEEKLIQTIAFGSCNKQDAPQPMWPFIVAEKPDLWLWLGDNIYADTEDMVEMQQMYTKQKRNPGYQELLKQCPILGTWDDHDYGVNDGGKDFPKKVESKKLMLDFLGVPKDAAVRKREGAYQSYTVGPEGKKVKIILLDIRYFRDPLKKNRDAYQRYHINQDGDVLGAAQWQWLEAELRNSKAQLNLIAGGIQFLPTEQGFEKWANFPKSRQRIMDLLEETKPARTILLSGDRHLAEVSRIELEGLNYPLFEVTSSGLTHSYEAADEPNQYRVSPLVGQKNYGVLNIDWSGYEPTVFVLVKGLNDQVFINLPLN